MKRILPLLILALTVFVLVLSPAPAKRAAPKPVAPVVANGMEYSAPHDAMGFVVATDAANHKELWRAQIYTVRIDPDLERDVQDVFITSLTVERGVLVINNERHEIYDLDLATRKVSKRK